jgi:hypothetical protein
MHHYQITKTLESRKDICAANDNSLLWKMQIVFSAELSPAKLKQES